MPKGAKRGHFTPFGTPVNSGILPEESNGIWSRTVRNGPKSGQIPAKVVKYDQKVSKTVNFGLIAPEVWRIQRDGVKTEMEVKKVSKSAKNSTFWLLFDHFWCQKTSILDKTDKIEPENA